MAQQCSICKKIPARVWRLVKLRGKYNPTIKRKQKPNLQWVTLESRGRVKACAKCIKTLAKTR
ncbi:MAG: hypothetical protein HYW95_01305 [Candidatus Wildermuthbacteria bacterium]|nr:hypothetical protein [Candidatus Wildermuthbacteria bacterium]